jgi:antitoxin YefM
MRTLTYTHARGHLAETFDAVVDDREEVVVTRAGHEPVVIVSLDEYESLRETAHLVRSPANAARLIAAVERLEAGGGVAHDLLDDSGPAPAES